MNELEQKCLNVGHDYAMPKNISDGLELLCGRCENHFKIYITNGK